MQSFERLSISLRLILLAGFACAAIAAAALLFAVADGRMDEALKNHAAAARIGQYTHEIEIGMASLRTRQHAFLTTGDAATAEAYAQASARLGAVLKALADIPLAAEVRTHLDTLRDGIAEHAEAFRKLTNPGSETLPTQGADLAARVDEAITKLEDRLAEAGIDSLTAVVLTLRRLERRYLAGETEVLADLVRLRQSEFSPRLLQAPLDEDQKAEIAKAMDGYIAALAELGRWKAEERRTTARLDDILDYLKPSVEAITGLRREAAAALDEAERDRQTARTVMLAGGGGVLVVFILLATLVTLSISRPIRSLAASAQELAVGNREAFVPVSTATNEIGQLARGLRAARDALAEAETRNRARDNRERSRKLHAEASRRVLAKEIEAEVMNATDALARASVELRELAESVAQAAQETGRRAQDVTVASQETTGNLRDLASVASTLHSSVAEIQRRIIALDPSGNGSEIDAATLSQVASELRGYLERVANISLRTRLMALNGIIGSVRKGDDPVGRGFEEVARQVGELAHRISGDGAAFGQRIEAAFQPLGDIAHLMQSQGKATRDILRSAEGAVAGALEMSNAVSRITRTANETGRVADGLLTAADEAARQSERLRGEIGDILVRLRN